MYVRVYLKVWKTNLYVMLVDFEQLYSPPTIISLVKLQLHSRLMVSARVSFIVSSRYSANSCIVLQIEPLILHSV